MRLLKITTPCNALTEEMEVLERYLPTILRTAKMYARQGILKVLSAEK